jgi:hypothetical protein
MQKLSPSRRSIAASSLFVALVYIPAVAYPQGPVLFSPANFPTPALFSGDVIRVVNSACPAGDSKTSGALPTCPTGACGFETLTLRTIQVFTDKVPGEVTIYHPQTDCKETDVFGRRLLVSILPDGSWSVFHILAYESNATVLPNKFGCLGDLDIKPWLPTKIGHREKASVVSRAAAWRAELTEHAGIAACATPIPEQLDDIGLPLTKLVSAWENAHGVKHKNWNSY